MQVDCRSAYDELGSVYPLLVDPVVHDAWMRRLEGLALDHGLCGRRVLDVACGTGMSFLPLLDLGYEVEACDISPRMLDLAARAAGGRAQLHEADMRALPEFGEFDLVTCIDDAANHLLDEEELTDMVAGFARNLVPGGLALFDVNTLRTMRSAFSGRWTHSSGSTHVTWEGLGDPHLPSGGTTSARIDLRLADEVRTGIVVRERHHPLDDLERVLGAGGLALITIVGQRAGGLLQTRTATEDDHKAVVLARRLGPSA